MPFDKQNEFHCKMCDNRTFKIVKGTVSIFLICNKCDSTDEITRRKLGWNL